MNIQVYEVQWVQAILYTKPYRKAWIKEEWNMISNNADHVRELIRIIYDGHM